MRGGGSHRAEAVRRGGVLLSPVRLATLVQPPRRVAQTSGRLAKIDLLATSLKQAAPEEIETAIAFLSGAPRQGRIGVGYATLEAARAERAADAPTLERSEERRVGEECRSRWSPY